MARIVCFLFVSCVDILCPNFNAKKVVHTAFPGWIRLVTFTLYIKYKVKQNVPSQYYFLFFFITFECFIDFCEGACHYDVTEAKRWACWYLFWYQCLEETLDVITATSCRGSYWKCEGMVTYQRPPSLVVLKNNRFVWRRLLKAITAVPSIKQYLQI